LDQITDVGVNPSRPLS